MKKRSSSRSQKPIQFWVTLTCVRSTIDSYLERVVKQIKISVISLSTTTGNQKVKQTKRKVVPHGRTHRMWKTLENDYPNIKTTKTSWRHMRIIRKSTMLGLLSSAKKVSAIWQTNGEPTTIIMCMGTKLSTHKIRIIKSIKNASMSDTGTLKQMMSTIHSLSQHALGLQWKK